MKRTVKALQDLYVKLGGNLTDTYAGIADGIKVGLYKRIPDIIEAVKEKASGGGGGAGLPEVTAEDNGDVLTVVEGAWAKASPSGALVVGVEYDEQTETPSLDKTWQEIHDAVKSGRGAVIVEEKEEEGRIVEANVGLVSTLYIDISINPTLYAVTDGFGNAWGTESADGYPTRIE